MRRISARNAAGSSERQDDEPKPLRGGCAVDRGGLEDVGRQRLQARKQDQRHERRPFPGVDRDKRGERSLRLREQAARAGKAELRQGIAEHAIFRTEQRLEDEPHDERRHRRRDEQKTERDPVEPVVTPQQQRDAKTKNEFNRHRAEGEQKRVDHRAACGRVPPQGDVIVEPDEMTRTRSDQVVALERVEKSLNHRPNRDRQHVNERRGGERDQKQSTLSGVRMARRNGGGVRDAFGAVP